MSLTLEYDTERMCICSREIVRWQPVMYVRACVLDVRMYRAERKKRKEEMVILKV